MTEKEIADLIRDCDAAQKELADAEKYIESLESDINEYQNEIRELEERLTSEPCIELLERLADTRNWIDGRYSPTMPELYDNVPDLCSAVLRENQ